MSSLTQHNINTSLRINMKKTKKQADKKAKKEKKAKEDAAKKAKKEKKAKEDAAKKAKKEADKKAKKEKKAKEDAAKKAKKAAKRIARIAIKAYKKFKPGYDTRVALRERIKLRSEKGLSCDLLSAVKQMLSSPFYKNEAAASGAVHNTARHEDAIARILEEKGNFIRYPLAFKLNRTETLKWNKNPELSKSIPDGTFIEQPFGTHNSPDFIIKVNYKCVLFLEAKSSSTTLHPTYNSGGVKPDFLYVFCAKKTDQTTIFKGDSVITTEQQRILDKHLIEARKRDKEINRELAAIDPNHRGIQYYTRPMIKQGGGATYTNYFTHQNREEAENYAIEWIKNKLN